MSGDERYGMCVSGGIGTLFLGVGDRSVFQAADGLVVDGEPGKLNGDNAFRIVYGPVAPEVSGVVIRTADGRQVDATVAHGRFFAWWPSGAEPTTITASASDGHTVVVAHPTPAANPVPTHKPATK